MNRQDVFAGAQIVTQHPILVEEAEVRSQYYAYLKKLIKSTKMDRRKFSKAQLSFYQNALCGENAYVEQYEDWRAIRRYCYLLPFDVAAVLAYSKKLGTFTATTLINQIRCDFDLPYEAAGLLHSEFLAALGDEQAWDDIFHEKKLSRHKAYFRLVRNNLAFIQERPYSILITATMSAGKSTLINALVGQNISLMQNMAATSKIHTIISKSFDDGVTTEYDSEISLDATKDELLTDNESNRTSRITVSTYFNGLLCGQRITLYDSPGVNSSENPEHTEITNKMIRSKKYKLLVYVLNATQLGTTDEEQHLDLVAKAVGRRNILFVMNKIDHLISEDESLSDVIMRQVDFLKQKGFKAPIICPVSARAAYLAKKGKKEQLSRLERRELESYSDKFAQSGLPEYYENEMGCPPISGTGDETDDLYRDCGFAYFENIIIQYKKGEIEMAQVYVKYNPYRLETTLMVNGREVPTDSSLYKITKGKRLQEWVGMFPQKLRDELNTVDFSLEFYGMALDWDDFEDAFEQAQNAGIVKVSNIRFTAGKSDDDVADKIVQVFTDLKEGPIADFRDPKLLKAFESTNNSIFPVNVIATMSSGKSTLINALLQTKLMPSKNEACTATITEILDTDGVSYTAIVYNEDGQIIQEVPALTYEVMGELNDNVDVHRICAEGNIPFLDSRNTALMLVDTPGPNNAQNQAHKNTTYRAINNDSNNLILYVLNGTQLSTNDDAALLHYVADQIKKGGKQVRDRFLFVINKMDQFNPEEEDIGKAIASARRYLASYGIEDPQLFPCSAYTALNIRTYFADIDIDNLTRAQERALPLTARDTLPMIDKFIDYESMHLEQYSTLSPSAQQDLNYRLSQAIERGDTKEQALIHSGICSIEAAITAYVTKYAKTKKIKDLVETFQEVLESSQVLVKAKTMVATDEQAAKACADRAAAVKRKIEDGAEAKAFKQKIAELDPMPKVTEKADQLRMNATTKTGMIFRPYGENITSRDEAKRLVGQFSVFSSDTMAELTSELESAINNEIVATGKRLLAEYQEKLAKFDDGASDEQLDFQTVDLVKGVLTTMRETAESWTTDAFAAETVDDVGETSYEERTYYEKVGQEEERVVSGQHEEKVGTRKVKVGSHREKVGTRKVANPNKRWWKIFTPKYIEEAVYETVDDYKDEDVYKTVLEYTTVMRDVFEEKTERIEKFSVKTALIQQGLIAKMSRSLDEGIESALGFAAEQVETMKAQFSRIFDELDAIIADKYEELEKCATDQSEKEKRLRENQELLKWIETNMAEINSILDV